MTREEAREFLIGISYKLGNMSVEYLSEKDGKKMREAIEALEQEPTQMIDKSNFSQEQYKADLQSAYDCGKSILDKLRAEITTLQNRCYALTKGTMCAFCRYECEYKGESED